MPAQIGTVKQRHKETNRVFEGALYVMLTVKFDVSM